MCACECNKACKIDEYLDTKIFSCETRLIGKLVLRCEDEILNTTETSLDDKKVTCKENCLIHTISLMIKVLLLLTVLSVACYYYYTRDSIKKEQVVPY